MKPQFWLLTFLFAGALVSCTKELLIDDPGNLVPKTVIEDPTIPAISVNGATLHSEAFGHPDSTMLVVVHGGPGSDYRSLLKLKELAQAGYRVVFYDQRGSGLSERFDAVFYESLGEAVIPLFIEDLRGVIAHFRTHSDQRVILIGDSWGGMLSAAYAGKYPGEVHGLVVSEPGGLKWNDIAEYVKRSRSFSMWGEAFNNYTYIDQFLSGDDNDHEILDYKVAISSSINEITGEGVRAPNLFWRGGAVCNASMFKAGKEYEPDLSVGLEQFDVPVLFFYTEKNTAYQLSWAQRISSAFNQVQLFEITDIGHSEMYTVDHVWTQVTKPALLTYFQSLQ